MSPDAATEHPWLSVVVAARAGEGDIDRCLAALERQRDDDVELIIATDGARPSISGPRTKIVTVPHAVVPELWAAGIAESSGRQVGLLAATVVPDDDWISRTRLVHADGAAGVGGAIEPDHSLGFVDWAVYFCRYAPYMRPLQEGVALELAADNVSYRADVLAAYAHVYRDGFWEPFVHDQMRRDGCTLSMTEDRVVRHVGRTTIRAFCSLRFRHGQQHGARVAAPRRRLEVLVRAMATPVVPVVMTSRTALTVFAKRRHRCRFLASLPVVAVFYVAWALGETFGALGVGSAHR